MKKKIISILSLCVISIASVIALAGCGGGVTTADVLESYNAMQEILLENDSVLNKGDTASYRNTKNYYQISYGDVVDEYIQDYDENYVDLRDYYNSVFSFAMSYVDENITVITNLEDEELNSETKRTLSDLKDSIDDFSDSIQNFVDARNRLDIYYQNNVNVANPAENSEIMARLRAFKREYVDFVDKSVQMSLNLSNSVEATGIYEDVNNVRLIKNNICNKIIRVYNELYILDVGTFNFAEYQDTNAKIRIQALLDELQNSMTDYSSIMQLNDVVLKQTLTPEELDELTEMTDKFLTEMDVYVEALDGLDIQTLGVDYNNDMEEYLNHNERALIYLERVENFINISLPDFLEYLDNMVRA